MTLVRRGRRIAAVTYQRLAAPFGARVLRQMLGDGLPRQLEAPFRFLFGGRAPKSAIEASCTVESLRARIAHRGDVYRYAYFDSTLGPVRLAQRADDGAGTVPLSRYATSFSVPKRWGLFLHLCASA